MNNGETTAVTSDEISVEETWPGEWKARFKDFEGRWTHLSRPFRTRKLAVRAAQIAWMEDRVP